ncbi:hypothetical protein C1Y63_05110 [Corynebacterium sp. 13CS0277]|uniref:hypothetical protein n=1 Tax=Corynebacterium sp. 13CS0277 TaxID=2071994 RepID=UPI000D02267E|nr:hypothetical protein [Corynebacterium sp. 13CS0277]PRQ11563.1 hypothetical protein C1Y63_05110 [Corynebacterium sp. 13CS0277]
MKHAHDEGQGLVDKRLGEIAADDAFLDALAAGTDPSGGMDPLAGLLLELKHSIDSAPMPPAPVLVDDAGMDAAPTTVFPPVGTASAGLGDSAAADPRLAAGAEAAPSASAAPTPTATASAGGAQVIDLAARRRRRGSNFMSGLVGAAAATLLIAGSGVAIHNATPGSPLWGANTAIFGDHAAVVELATTLDEAGSRTDSGDIEGALALLDKAKALANDLSNQKPTPKPAEQPRVTVTQRETATDTVTVTATPSPQPPSEERKSEAPTTVVSTVTKTVAPQAPAEIDPVVPDPQRTTQLPTMAVEIPPEVVIPEPTVDTPNVGEIDPIAETTVASPDDGIVAEIDTRVAD